MTSARLYVGNFPWSTTEDDLRTLFGQHGAVRFAKIITDRETGRSRGFGFVEFESIDDAQLAMTATDEQDFNGRALRVREASQREPSSEGQSRPQQSYAPRQDYRPQPPPDDRGNRPSEGRKPPRQRRRPRSEDQGDYQD